jgi:prepilin-type N-terminal cleavage/methylation domain-containing protein
MPSRRITAFTLIELAIVVAVLGLLAAAVFRYQANLENTQNYAALNETLDAIEDALQNYAVANGYLPCPSDFDHHDNYDLFGTEIGTAGDGLCNEGGNTFTNPVDPSLDPDFADGLYDSATAAQVAAGAVPTKTLKLDDESAYDPWGRKILYVVDQRITATDAFTTYDVTDTTIGAIVVKKTSTDTLANSVTYKGVYAIVSHGPNGHGGFNLNPSADSSPTRFNAGSTNTNELKNCHCDDTATTTMFDRIFVQNSKTATTTLTNSFDDVVRVKTRMQMGTAAEFE